MMSYRDLHEDDVMAIVDLATTLRTVIDAPNVPEGARTEARLAMFCVNMLGAALGCHFDMSAQIAN